jgi:hypothetical protein
MRPLGALALLLFWSATANAQDLGDRFNIRLSLSGMYLTETQDSAKRETREASTFDLGYGDLRATIDARRLPGRLELHLDGRVRVTDEYSTDSGDTGASQTLQRGYLGGREYELRSTYLRRRGDSVDFALGRLIVNEADALKIDGARVWVRFGRHWDLSGFAGGYPNPYSRSLLTDYTSSLALAGGLDSSYTYDRIWGSFSAVAAYLGGNDDGGPLDPKNPNGKPSTENIRAYITWTDFVRIFSWLDFHHDLVLDVASAAGAQLTRLDLTAIARAGRFVTIRLGFDHMSALAIEMYLTRLLANRPDFVAGTIENNLVVQRTARDQGRAQVDVTLGKLTIFGEGRIRRRALVELQEDPNFVNAGKQVAPDLAYDATIGLRDRGSLAGLRPGIWYTYLSDYRSTSNILGLELGRNFLDDRLTFDASFLYALTRDNGAGQQCPVTIAAMTPLIPACYGDRDGNEYELGLTITGAPSLHWFMFVDYRLVIDTQNGPANALLTHMLLGRVEMRY